VPQTVVTFGGPGISATIRISWRLCREPYSRRRRSVVALYHEVREKRGLAYSVYESLL